MSRPTRECPSELVDAWPESVSADPVVEAARLFVLNLREAIGDSSARSVAREAGINHVTLASILHGRAWADTHTLAKLEHSLGIDLWPGVSTGLKGQGVLDSD